MIIDAPKTPEYPINPPPRIEISADIGAEKLTSKTGPKKMAAYALKKVQTETLKAADTEEARYEKIAEKLVKKYEGKGGIEVVPSDTSAQIEYLAGDDNPNHSIAIVCKENSFPVLLEFRELVAGGSLGINLVVEGQSYTDPKTNKQELLQMINKRIKQGYILTKADVAMPHKANDEGTNLIYRHLAGELATIIENSKHIDGMHVEVTSYDNAQVNKKDGVVFMSEMDEGGHYTTTKINNEEVHASPEYAKRFA